MRYYNRKSCAECFQATKACDMMSCWQRSTCCWSLMGWEAWCSADTNAVTALWSGLCLAMAVAGQKVLWFSESHCASVQLQDEAPKTFNSCYINLQISFWDIHLKSFHVVSDPKIGTSQQQHLSPVKDPQKECLTGRGQYPSWRYAEGSVWLKQWWHLRGKSCLSQQTS